MTVQELLDLLSAVTNKNLKVVINADGEAIEIVGIDVESKLVWIES